MKPKPWPKPIPLRAPLTLFDRQRTLIYRGQLDESRPGNQIPATGKDMRAAIEAVLADQPINPGPEAKSRL